MMNQTEHIGWCKKRAQKYLDNGDIMQAFISMASDLKSHPDTENHCGIELGMSLLMIGDLNTFDKMQKFIDGFH